MNKEENEIQAIFKFYDSARQELTVRLTARDNTLLVYLAGVAAVIGASVKGEVSIEFLLVIPYIALGISLIVANHHRGIAMLTTYCAKDLSELMVGYGIVAPKFELSPTRLQFMEKGLGPRFLGDFVILNVPSIFAILLNIIPLHSETMSKETFGQEAGKPVVLIVFAAGCVFACVLVLWRTYKLRQNLRKSVQEYLDSQNPKS